MSASDDGTTEANERPDEHRPAGSDPTKTEHPTGGSRRQRTPLPSRPGDPRLGRLAFLTRGTPPGVL